MMYEGKIKITLKSDLCIGSGYSYAGIVDSDVCYDETGIPFIPGKRLKGCFRETANSFLHSLYDDEFINTLFGERGQKEASKLTIGNAVVSDYDEISQALKAKIKENDQKYNKQSILGQYSRVIGQTALTDSGSADEGSLRYTRVVNRHIPGNPSSELVFEAPVFANISAQEKEGLENIIEATKHIGLKRNRGLGSVSIKLTDMVEKTEEKMDLSVGNSEEPGTISFTVINKDPLILSSESSDESENFIMASNVIGALASRYLSLDGTSAEDVAFKDLFLNGKVRFTNLYPSVNGKEYYPAPEYINSMKKSKKIVYLLDEDGQNSIEKIVEDNEETQNYSRRNGNQPKKLKGKFVYFDDEKKISTMEVDKEVVYHHSHYIDNSDGTQGLLYAMEVISPGQTFSGKIIAPEKYNNLIISLLKKGDFYFGKSKTAQYGRCELCGELKSEKTAINKKTYNAGDKIVVTLKSDAIFMNESGAYTVYSDEVSGIIADVLGIGDAEHDQEFVKTGRATGYMGVWNLRKPSVPVVKAGSAFVYKLKSAVELPEGLFIGERCHEGNGQISLANVADMHYKMDVSKVDAGLEAVSTLEEGPVKAICDEIENECWLREEKLQFIGRKLPFSNPAGLGRVTLMLKESLASSGDYKEQFQEFVKRVESISENNKLRNEALTLLKFFGEKNEENWAFTWLDNENLPSGIKEKRKSYWGECLMTKLIVAKYDFKEGK